MNVKAHRFEVFWWAASAAQYVVLVVLASSIWSWSSFRVFAGIAVLWFGCFLAMWHARELYVEDRHVRRVDTRSEDRFYDPRDAQEPVPRIDER